MSSIQWTEALAVNVAVIDEQHKSLCQSLAKLETLLQRKSGRSEIEEALKELAEHTRRHFETEEHLMAAHAYPDRCQHTHIAHVHLLEDLTNLRLDYHSGTLHFNAKTMHFLKNWLVGHIQADQELGAFLNSKGVR